MTVGFHDGDPRRSCPDAGAALVGAEATAERAGRGASARPRQAFGDVDARRRSQRLRRLQATPGGRAARPGRPGRPRGGARSMHETVEIELTVNDKPRNLRIEPRETLAEVLRERLSLTGTKVSCDAQVCGACTVLVDGLAISACTYLAVDADGTGRADGRGPRARTGSSPRSSRRSSTAPRSSAASARRGCSWRRPRCSRRTRTRRRDEVQRGPGRQPVPLHRLRARSWRRS